MKQELHAIFKFIYGVDGDGYMRIFSKSTQNGAYEETFFEWPEQADDILAYISRHQFDRDLYFCPHLFSRPNSSKQYAMRPLVLWADLDKCSYENMLVEPTIVMSTSYMKQQALWSLKDYAHPSDVEMVNKRIAYYHADEGADKSGWDLTQLLRIPFTSNFKYETPQSIKVIKSTSKNRYTLKDFAKYPELEEEHSEDSEELRFPEDDELGDEDAEEVLNKYKYYLSPRAMELFTQSPTDDWSNALWELEMCLFEAGMSPKEAFVVSKDAACNKYERDGRKQHDLWKDVTRAYKHVQNTNSVPITMFKSDSFRELITNDEAKWVEENPDISQEYVEWASSLSDAAWQYHQAGVFTILSTLLTGAVRLPTSFGTILPNLWFMILADTTLTRKSTAMDIAMDLLQEVDSDAILATDGSIEGLLTSLSTRPGRPSIFWRDEFTGLMEMVGKKDYYSGMLETFTKLYDGKFMRRQLRKETIEVREPILIMLTGGIKSRMIEQLEHSHVTSGFIPRFIFITATADITKIKPLGPPTDVIDKQRQRMLLKFYNMRKHYWSKPETQKGKLDIPSSWNAELTPDAWARYNDIDTNRMLNDALRSNNQDVLTPVFDRLSKSGLKVAVLLAAASKLDEKVVVEEEHIIRAFWYVQQWRQHTLYITENLGTNSGERTLEMIRSYIEKNGKASRSEVMRKYKLTAREMDGNIATLEQRGLIARSGKGKGESYSVSGIV